MAVSSYLVEYSTNARGYTLQTLAFVVLLTLVSVAVRRDSSTASAWQGTGDCRATAGAFGRFEHQIVGSPISYVKLRAGRDVKSFQLAIERLAAGKPVSFVSTRSNQGPKVQRSVHPILLRRLRRC